MLLRHAGKELARIVEQADFGGTCPPRRFEHFACECRRSGRRSTKTTFALKSLDFEKLRGDRKHQYSMRLNDQFRLIFEIDKGDQGNTIAVLGIEDYH